MDLPEHSPQCEDEDVLEGDKQACFTNDEHEPVTNTSSGQERSRSIDKEVTSSGGKLDDVKIEVPNCFGQYLKREKLRLKQENPEAKLDFEKALRSWNEMPEEERSRFKIMSQQERIKLGSKYRKGIKRNSASVEDVKAVDRERKRKERRAFKLLNEDEEYCSSKFKSILSKEETKHEEMVARNIELQKEYLDLTSQNEGIIKQINYRDRSLDSWKSKYRALYEEHKLCNVRPGHNL